MVIHDTRSEGGCASAVRSLGIPTAMQTAPYPEADQEFQIVGQSCDRTHSQAKGNLSERHEFRRVDNSIWRYSKTSCALFRRCGGMLTRPLASSDRSRRCCYATLPFKRHELRLYSAHCVRTKA